MIDANIYFLLCLCTIMFQGNRSTGDNFPGVPNIDHSQQFVRKDIIAWLQWLRNSVGFQDFRFDFARG
jgi:alpha-amylase